MSTYFIIQCGTHLLGGSAEAPLSSQLGYLDTADIKCLFHAEDRVLWYSGQYRDWDVTNGSVAQEVGNTLHCMSQALAPLFPALEAALFAAGFPWPWGVHSPAC